MCLVYLISLMSNNFSAHQKTGRRGRAQCSAYILTLYPPQQVVHCDVCSFGLLVTASINIIITGGELKCVVFCLIELSYLVTVLP